MSEVLVGQHAWSIYGRNSDAPAMATNDVAHNRSWFIVLVILTRVEWDWAPMFVPERSSMPTASPGAAPPVPGAAPAVATATPAKFTSGLSANEVIDRAAGVTATAGVDYSVPSVTDTLTVFYDPRTRKNSLAAAKLVIISNPDASTSTQVVSPVIIAKANPDRTSPRYFLWCGDDFLEGALSGPEQRRRITDALTAIGLPLLKQVEVEKHLRNAGGVAPPSSHPRSHFWDLLKADPKTAGCEHVRQALHHLRDQPGGIEGALFSLDAAYEALSAAAPKTNAAAVTTAANPSSAGVDANTQARMDLEAHFIKRSPLHAKILSKCGPFKKHKIPVMVLGEAGQSKTHTAEEIGRSGLYEAFFRYGCSSGHDEYDLLGSTREACLPGKDGNLQRLFPPCPSEITQAFKAGSQGKVVALLIDELPSLREDAWNVFKMALSCYDGDYKLKTTRIVGLDADGNGIHEQIVCPRKNLAIFATGNIGDKYNSRFGDHACENRFAIVYMDEDPAHVVAISKSVAIKEGFDPAIGTKLASFMTIMQRMRNDAMIENLPNIRDFTDAILLAEGDEKAIATHLADLGYRWCGKELSSRPNQEQWAIVRKCIKDTFSSGT